MHLLKWEKKFKLKTENRDTELKTLTEWISGQINNSLLEYDSLHSQKRVKM